MPGRPNPMRHTLVLGIAAVILGQGCSNAEVQSRAKVNPSEYKELPLDPLSCFYCMGRGDMGEPISSCGWCRGTGLKPSALALKEWPPLVKKSSNRVVDR